MSICHDPYYSSPKMLCFVPPDPQIWPLQSKVMDKLLTVIFAAALLSGLSTPLLSSSVSAGFSSLMVAWR